MPFLYREKGLAIINPTLAKQWYPNKNGDLRPKYVTTKSNMKVWWP
jgi:Probable Zinc-ribbon domain